MAGLVRILANPHCPHCVHATDLVTDWCCEAGVPVAGVDLAHHPEAGAPWTIEHSPSLLIERDDGSTRVLTGLPTHEEFARLVRP